MRNIDTNCTRPVLFENEDPSFRFSKRGTAFFVSYKGKVYGITAYHVVDGFHPRQYRLLRSRNGGECFEYRQPFTGNRKLDENIYDFVIIPLCENAEDIAEDVFVWPLPNLQPKLEREHRIWVDGYPDEQGNIEYGSRMLEFQGGIIQTVYDGLGAGVGIHRLQVTSDHNLKSFSGFSGAPAYLAPLCEGPMSTTQIIGITIQGSPESGIIHVINILAAKALIDLALKQKDGGAEQSGPECLLRGK